jgi:hypothetical protein
MTGRDGLGEFARRLAGEAPPSPPPSSVMVPRHRAVLPIPDIPNEPAEPSPEVASLLLRKRTPVSRWLGAAAAVVGVLAIGASVAVLIHHVPVAAPKAGAGRTARLPPARISPQPAELPTAQAAPGAAVLEPPAPRALGYLENALLTLSPAGCGPGSTCTLMSRIDLGSHPQGTVTWQVVAIDRCSGGESVLASASGVDAVNDQYMWQDVTATLPRGDPLALYVVSLAPVRVASAAGRDRLCGNGSVIVVGAAHARASCAVEDRPCARGRSRTAPAPHPSEKALRSWSTHHPATRNRVKLSTIQKSLKVVRPPLWSLQARHSAASHFNQRSLVRARAPNRDNVPAQRRRRAAR